MRRFEKIAGVLGILAMAGCQTTTLPRGNVDVEVPVSWTGRGVTGAAPTNWLRDLSDARLSALVQEAVNNNRDLRSAAARLRAARANAVISGADRYPQIGVGFDGSRRRLTSETFGSSAGGSGTSEVIPSWRNDFGLSLDVSWEIDLWGRLRNQARAATSDFLASRADYRAAQLSLAVNVAQGYYDCIEAHEQLLLAKNTLASRKSAGEFVWEKFIVGLQETSTDVDLSKADIANAEANVHSVERQLGVAKQGLEILLGRYPSESLSSKGDFPTLRNGVPAGLPAQLLGRRPDLLAARHRVDAALDRVGVSKKELLPGISLTASGGTSSQELRDVLDPERLIWNLAGSIVQPIFQGKRLTAALEVSRADLDEALADYSETALQAFREVEVALRSEVWYTRQEKALLRAVKHSKAAETQTNKDYESGVETDIIRVLEAQRRSFEAQQALLSVRNERIQNRLDLYLALGGDFQGD